MTALAIGPQQVCAISHDGRDSYGICTITGDFGIG